MKKDITTILKKRILVLDGALGTLIQRYNLKELDYRIGHFEKVEGNLLGFNELLSLTRPEIISEIHEKYLKVGADIIETNTLRANRLTLEEYGIEEINAYELNFASAKLAREKVVKYTNLTLNKPRYLAGSVGPLSPEIPFETAVEVYTEQIKGLLAGNVDFILLETMTNENSIIAATEALNNIMKKRNRRFKLAISGSATGNNHSPIKVDFIRKLVLDYPNVEIFAIGENCGLGFEDVLNNIRKLADSEFFIIAYPNSLSKDGKELTLEEQLDFAKKFIDEGLVNIIGGCCGTDYDFIENLVKFLKRKK